MGRAQLRQYQKWNIEEPVINLTPLIDVVFVILVMFIIIAPLLELDRIDLADSSSDSSRHHTTAEQSPITVHVYQDNTIRFNNLNVKTPELASLFLESKQSYPGVRPQILHDRRAHFGTYQAIKNAAEAAGFEQLDIVLKP